jgi:MoaA/NifB/PqqE/SkfB family radical SAM enzyme
MAFLDKARGIIARSLTPDRPYHAQWMLTRRCNYRCKGCNVWQEQDTKELSTQEIKDGLDTLRQLGVVEVVLSGGNPLLRKDIDEIIEYASRYFITTVYDNGSMAAEKKDALRFADFVPISIDSLNPKKNDYIKGVPGAWKKAMQTVDELHEARIGVGVSATISQLNMYEIVDITEHFLKKNIPVWYSLYSYDSGEGKPQLFKIGKQNDEFLITDREGMVNLCDNLMAMKNRNSRLLLTDKILEAVRTLYSQNKRIWRCQALQSFLIINHLGRVSGCHVHDPIGSINDLPKIWNSERLNNLRADYSKCAKCTYLCYIFYSLHGTVFENLKVSIERWKNLPLVLKKK